MTRPWRRSRAWLKRSPIQRYQRSFLEVRNKIARLMALVIGHLSQRRRGQQGDGVIGVGGWGWMGGLQHQRGAIELDGRSLVDVP